MAIFTVEAMLDDKEQYDGIKQHDLLYDFCDEVEAETAEEALELAIGWYSEQCINNHYEVEDMTSEFGVRHINVYKDGELYESRYNFEIFSKTE